MIVYISASEAELHPLQQELARRLEHIHGDIYIANEASGIHFYMASPERLLLDGEVELQKRHLAVNVTKALEGVDLCANCMKTPKPYTLSSLLRYVPLDQRGIKYHVKTGVVDLSDSQKQRMEEVSSGVFLPWKPGGVTSLLKLPKTHPAVEYLTGRNFDILSLCQQFNLTYCHAESPNIFYKRGPNGFNDTPQGRIIFYLNCRGYQGWQARVIERNTRGITQLWHPYLSRFETVSVNVDGVKHKIPPYTDLNTPKYKTADGTRRNQHLMGYDTAVLWNRSRTPGERVSIITEGPLDAGRIGPPACAALGKYLSKEQLELARSAASRIIYVSQNDKPAQKSREGIQKLAAAMQIRIEIYCPPEQYNDVGDMSPEACRHWLKNTVNISL